MSIEKKRLKRAVIKEELVALTGNYVDAILLNQFLYWSERVEDFDKFIMEEQQRALESDSELHMEPLQGWIYKKADELADETMIGLSKSNMLTHIKRIVERGWIEQRRNPKNKMDKTYQYRVNITQIQKDLLKLNYALEGYRIPLGMICPNPQYDSSSISELRNSKTELRSSKTKPPSSNTLPHSSNTEQQYQRLHTEITSEITSKQTTAALQELNAAVEQIAPTKEPTAQNDDVVVSQTIKEQLNTIIKMSIVASWIQTYGREYVLSKLSYVVANAHKYKNLAGVLRKAVEQDWDVNLLNNTSSSKTGQDKRYPGFYDLFPDA